VSGPRKHCHRGTLIGLDAVEKAAVRKRARGFERRKPATLSKTLKRLVVIAFSASTE
jgi:hypothetical protein